MRTPLRLLLACISGLLLACAFPPIGWWWVSPLALATLVLLMRSQRLRVCIFIALAFGYSFIGLLCQWLRVLGWDALLAGTLFVGSFFALVGVLWYGTLRTRLWPLWTAAAYVAVESLLTVFPWGGFPWGRLAFLAPGHAPAGLAPIGGEGLVSFAIALSATLLAWSIARVFDVAQSRADRGAASRALLPALGMLLLAIALPASGALVSSPTSGQGSGPQSVQASAVQGNVPRLGLDFNSQAYAVLDNHVQETLRLAASVAAGQVPQPQFVLWPENSSDIDPYTSTDAATRISTAVDAINAPTLVGAYVDDPTSTTRFYNLSMEWLPHGQNPPPLNSDRVYVKRQPVPFGEMLPFRSLLTKVITRFDRVPRDMIAGSKPGVFQLGPAKVGNVICFEVAYDRIVGSAVKAGGRMITVQTNNATYGETGQPDQQLQITRLRAIEYNRAVLVAATSGISAVIAPDGTVEQQSKQFTATSLSARIPLRSNLTWAVYDRAWVNWGIALLGVLFAIIGVSRKKNVVGKGAKTT